MPRARRKPFDPNKPIVHDRRTVDKLKDAQLAPIEIDDPYEAGAKILAMRSTRDDPLADYHARKYIDEAQYQAGRAFQRDFEAAEKGGKGFELKEAVDGGGFMDPLTDEHLCASDNLKKIYKVLGQDGTGIVHDVLVHARTMKGIASSRGRPDLERYFGERFRECLDRMAVVYGFA